MIERLRAMRDDESGAMLIVALIVITCVSVVTGALMAQGGAGFRATAALQGVAGTSYTADTAAKVAINNVRLGSKAPGWVTPTFPGPWTDWVYTDNADGAGCFGADGTAPKNSLELTSIYPRAGDQTADTSARVECTPIPGTGIFSGVGVDNPDPTDAFAQALTTLGTTGTLQGMTLKPLGSGGQAAMPVRGGIASKSYINITNGALVTDGSVKAEGACTGQIVSNPPAVCNAPGTVSAPTPPSPVLTSVPAYQNPSTYASSCTFQPGFYNNAKALSDAVNGCALAKFASGQYYFDFRDEERGTGQNEWNIATKVIGGEYVSPGNIPGACKSPILYDPVPGVQFVFGGTSRITVSDTAHVELCGPSNAGDPPITLSQEPTGNTEPTTALAPASAGTATQLTGNGGGNKWTTGTVAPTTTPPTSVKDAIAAVDTKNVTYTIAGNNDDVGIDLSSFAGLDTIPAGADVSSAILQVKYARTGTGTQPLQVSVATQTPTNVAITAPDATGWGQADVAGQLRGLLASGTLDATRPVLQLRMMDATKNDTLTIDAVKLTVTYVKASLRAGQDVKLVNDPGANFHGEFVVQGATYAPKGYIDLDPGSYTTALVAFRWGLLASGVNLKAQPSQQFGYPLVSVPVAGHGLGNRVTIVDLKVYVCVQQSSCASGGTHALTVRVMITDPPYSPWGSGPARPEPGRRQVQILSWSEQK